MQTIDKARKMKNALETEIANCVKEGDFKTVAVIATYLNGVTTASLARLHDNVVRDF